MADSGDEIVVIGYLLVNAVKDKGEKRKRRRSVWVKEWVEKRHKHGAFHGLLGELGASDQAAFKNFIRMDSDSFHILTKMISPLIARHDTKLRPSIPVEERLSVTLRYLATGLLHATIMIPVNLSLTIPAASDDQTSNFVYLFT